LPKPEQKRKSEVNHPITGADGACLPGIMVKAIASESQNQDILNLFEKKSFNH
jgi:hypothetical protein